jgi:hypothetical protein
MTVHSHHGEGKHDKRDMAVPAVQGAGFVVNSFFAVSKLSSIVQRRPSTLTSVSKSVPGERISGEEQKFYDWLFIFLRF